jgi:hypothetical protein
VFWFHYRLLSFPFVLAAGAFEREMTHLLLVLLLVVLVAFLVVVLVVILVLVVVLLDGSVLAASVLHLNSYHLQAPEGSTPGTARFALLFFPQQPGQMPRAPRRLDQTFLAEGLFPSSSTCFRLSS